MKAVQTSVVYQKAVDEFVRRALSRYGPQIASMVLFGSVARGEATEDSDIDILVVIKERSLAIMRELYGLAYEVTLEYSVNISLKVYAAREVLHRLELGAPFIHNVLKDGVALYGEVSTGKITAQ